MVEGLEVYPSPRHDPSIIQVDAVFVVVKDVLPAQRGPAVVDGQRGVPTMRWQGEE
jgi:hypothetical protein